MSANEDKQRFPYTVTGPVKPIKLRDPRFPARPPLPDAAGTASLRTHPAVPAQQDSQVRNIDVPIPVVVTFTSFDARPAEVAQ